MLDKHTTEHNLFDGHIFILCSNYQFYIISEISFKFSSAIKACSSSFFIFSPFLFSFLLNLVHIWLYLGMYPLRCCEKSLKTWRKKMCWKFRMYVYYYPTLCYRFFWNIFVLSQPLQRRLRKCPCPTIPTIWGLKELQLYRNGRRPTAKEKSLNK